MDAVGKFVVAVFIATVTSAGTCDHDCSSLVAVEVCCDGEFENGVAARVLGLAVGLWKRRGAAVVSDAIIFAGQSAAREIVSLLGNSFKVRDLHKRSVGIRTYRISWSFVVVGLLSVIVFVIVHDALVVVAHAREHCLNIVVDLGLYRF